MGYAIAALIAVVGLVVFGKKKTESARFDPPSAPTPDPVGNGYAAFDPGGVGPLVGTEVVPAQPGVDLAGSWDDWTRVPAVVFAAQAPTFAGAFRGVTGRMYKRTDAQGVTHWQPAVYRTYIRVWPESPTGVASLGRALADGLQAKVDHAD